MSKKATSNGAKRRRRSSCVTQLGLVPIRIVPVSEIRPSPENDKLYKPISAADVRDLTASVKERGVKEPLVITLDGYILSGHRRFMAAKMAGLTEVPSRTENIRRTDDLDAFVALLREYNRQRVKTSAERLREELVSIDPTDAHFALREHRRKAACVDVEAMELGESRGRAVISAAKAEFLEAIKTAMEGRRAYWPLSDRQIHYALLNDPPLKHSSKPDSRYVNNSESYKALVELLTRARIAGIISFNAIADTTRPVATWDVHLEPGAFIARERKGLFRGYYRDLMQSQPNHVEVIAEKNTIAPMVQSVCSEFTIPMTSGRGYCSLPPRYDIAQRFRRSGKDKLILRFVSDFDPDGEEIASSFARSMRDDFGIRQMHPVKVALTGEQVEEFDLPPMMEAKSGSVNCKKFVELHGKHVWEALDPGQLQDIVRDAVSSASRRTLTMTNVTRPPRSK